MSLDGQQKPKTRGKQGRRIPTFLPMSLLPPREGIPKRTDASEAARHASTDEHMGPGTHSTTPHKTPADVDIGQQNKQNRRSGLSFFHSNLLRQKDSLLMKWWQGKRSRIEPNPCHWDSLEKLHQSLPSWTGLATWVLQCQTEWNVQHSMLQECPGNSLSFPFPLNWTPRGGQNYWGIVGLLFPKLKILQRT